MKACISVTLCREDGEKFFGPGPFRLLQEVEAAGSLRAAAQRMGMAYTKAFALIKRAEEALGFPLTRRAIGGKGGGGSALTPEAKELMVRYEAYHAACSRMADSLYHTHFAAFQTGGIS